MLKRCCLALLGAVLAFSALAQEEGLAPEQAFRFSARSLDAQTIEARWDIAAGYYMYRDKFAFVLAGGKLGPIVLPAGETKNDPSFGRVEIYHKRLLLRLPFAPTAGATRLRLQAQGQGCAAELGICYPPLTQTVRLSLPAPVKTKPPESAAVQAGSAPPAATSSAVVSDSAVPAPAAVDDVGQVSRLFRHDAFGYVLLAFFGFGLLLSLTPCTLPMIPIVAGIIVGHGHAITRRRAFLLSVGYVLGMACSYALAGVAAGFGGTLVSTLLQNAWVLGFCVLLFVFLAGAMFGFYSLQLPSRLQTPLAALSNRLGGNLLGCFLAGALAAVILGPCVAAPLAGALLYIARTGDAATGGLALFVLALGMGLPLVAVGTFSRALLPHAGPWMELVKKLFGIVLLGLALWVALPILPSWLYMLGWAGLLIVPAILLRALDSLPPHAPNWQRGAKGVGIVMLLLGGAMVVGAAGGADNPLQPLAFLQIKAPRADAPRFETIRNLEQLDARLAESAQPVLLDFYADWCVECRRMEREAYAAPAVLERLRHLRLLKIDLSVMTDENRAVLKRYGLFGPPAVLFFRPRGGETEALRLIGYQSAEAFVAHLDRVLAAPPR